MSNPTFVGEIPHSVRDDNLENMKPKKSDLLVEVVEHIDIKEHNVVPLVDAMSKMAFSARDLGRAAQIYEAMVRDENCAIMLCLAGSIFSAGLKNVIVDLIGNSCCAKRLVRCARQQRDAQDRHVVLSRRDGRANHFRAAAQMDRQHLRPQLCGRFYCARHRVRNVVQLQIEKNLCAGSNQSCYRNRARPIIRKERGRPLGRERAQYREW